MFTTACFSWAAPPRRRPAADRRSWPTAPAPTTVDATGAADEDAAFGCGWYESSHDLRQGVELTEIAWPEAAALPLAADRVAACA